MDNYDELVNGPYSLPRDLISEAQQQFHSVSRSLETVTGGFLTHRQVTALVFHDGPSDVELSASEVAEEKR
jgi:hypothetical protein